MKVQEGGGAGNIQSENKMCTNIEIGKFEAKTNYLVDLYIRMYCNF